MLVFQHQVNILDQKAMEQYKGQATGYQQAKNGQTSNNQCVLLADKDTNFSQSLPGKEAFCQNKTKSR